MAKETDYLVQSLFERESLDELSIDELRGLTEQYPYASVIHFLYTKKLKSSLHIGFQDAVSHSALFFNHPQWLQYQLNDEGEIGIFKKHNFLKSQSSLIEEREDDEVLIEEMEESSTEEITANQDIPTEEELNVPIEPYHTVDYFASQGIKLSRDEQKDELSKKVQSFTAWLRTMKRLQPAPETASYKNVEEIFGESTDVSHTSSSEVYTETLAEVYLKQGLREKAIEVYRKLSLQNPHNRATFADKIEQIKENKI